MWNLQGLSIRQKFLMLFITIPTIAISSYLFIALDIFNKDKIEYIFESSAMMTRNLGLHVDSEFEWSRGLLTPILTSIQDKTFASSSVEAFEKLDAIDWIGLFQFKAGTNSIDQLKIDHLGILEKQGGLFRSQVSESDVVTIVKEIDRVGRYLKFPSNSDRMLFGVPWKYRNEIVFAIASISQREFVNSFRQVETARLYLVSGDGTILLAPADETNTSMYSILQKEFVDRLFAEKLPEGTLSIKDLKKSKVFVAFNKISSGAFLVLSVVGESSITGVFEVFLRKSILFLILIASVTVLVSLWATNTITSSLHELLNATRRIMDGQFDLMVRVKSRDEIATLASNFNLMSMEVARLLRETSEKSRMEAELKTAQVIQDTLFPEPEFKYEYLTISGHFQPASEIGGDWWFHSRIGTKVFLWIGDATGHGAPAALLTSAARSAATVLETLAFSPAKILELMNRAIYDVSKGQMMMTFFLASIDLKTKKMVYSNASHEPPLLLRKQGEVFKKSMIEPINDVTSPRLGEARDTKYEEAEIMIAPTDSIFFYTDGVEELRNKKKETLGDRGFMRAFVKCYHDFPVPNLFVERLVNFFAEYSQGTEVLDDVTFFVCRHD